MGVASVRPRNWKQKPMNTLLTLAGSIETDAKKIAEPFLFAMEGRGVSETGCGGAGADR